MNLKEQDEVSDFNFSLDQISSKELDWVLKYGIPKDYVSEYKSRPFIELPFGVVRIDFKACMERGNVQEAWELILGCQYAHVDLKKASGNDLMSFVLWMIKQSNAIDALEREHLASEPDIDLLASGIDKLNIFGLLPIIDNLAGGDIMKYEEIKKLAYCKVFDKLKLDKVQEDIQKNYRRIIEEKNKKK